MLKVRIAGSGIALLVIVVGAFYVLISLALDEASRPALAARTASAVSSAKYELLQRSSGGAELLRALAKEPAVKTFLEAADMAGPHKDEQHEAGLKFLEDWHKKTGADMVWLIDRNGKVAARLSPPEKFGDGVKGFQFVASALEGQPVSDTLIFEGNLFTISSTPVFTDKSAVPVGAVAMGFALSEGWLKTLKTKIKTDFIVVIDGKVKAATAAAQLSTDIINRIKDGKFLEYRPDVDGDAFDLVMGDARYLGHVSMMGGDLKNFQVGIAALVKAEFEPPSVKSWELQMLLAVIVGAALLFVGVAFWISRSLTAKAKDLSIKIVTVVSYASAGKKLQPDMFLPEFLPIVETVNKHVAVDTRRVTETRDAIKAEQAELASKLLEASSSKKQEKSSSSFKVPEGTSPDKTPVPPRSDGAEGSPANGKKETAPKSVRTGTTQPKEFKTQEMQKMEMPKSDGKPEAGKSEPGRKDASKPLPIQAAAKAKQSESSDAITEDGLDIGGAKSQNIAITQTISIADAQFIPMDENEYFSQVFEEFLKLRESLGEPVEAVNREKFIGSLSGNADRLKEKFGCTQVKFTVFEKNGKASVKGAPVRKI